jgi:CO/xanthine dehydrogenase Mo-binding subunit
VEVEVDEENKEVDILRYLALADVGRPINPKAVEGQIEGAAVQGTGYALFEEMEFDENGVLGNPSFRGYRLPTSEDIPDIEVELVETYEPTGPFGAKSVGEVCFAPAAPALANAIYDATGERFGKLPILKELEKEEFS